MKGEIFMNKKLLSAILAGALAASTVVVPATVGAEESDSGTVTVTYSPSDYVMRFDAWMAGQYENGATRYDGELAVNCQPYTNIRTDMADMYSQYQISAPEAIEKVEINIPAMKLKGVNVKSTDESGTEITTFNPDAIVGLGIWYRTGEEEIPADGRYYCEKGTQTNDDGSTTTIAVNPVGGETVDEVNTLLAKWKRSLFFGDNQKELIPDVKASAFGVDTSLMTTSSQKFDVTKDITDIVVEDIVAAKNENNVSYFNVLYNYSKTYGVWAQQKDTYTDGNVNWGKETTLTVTYSIDKILEDVNSAATADELKAKVKMYAGLFGTDAADFNEDVLTEKIPAYVGTTFTWDSFEAMLNSVLPVDITNYASYIGEKNVSMWAIEGETVTNANFEGGAKAGLIFKNAKSMKDSYTFKPFKVTVDDDGNVTYPENGDEVTFKFDTATASANVNDHINVGANNTLTITDIARYAKRIYYIGYNATSNDYTRVVKVTYKDGTVEEITTYTGNSPHGNYKTNANYVGDFDRSVSRIGNNTWGVPSNTDGVITSSNISGGETISGFDVDPTKIIEKIEFPNTNTVLGMAAMSESVMSNAELRAYIAEVEKYEEATEENTDEIMIARAYADELKVRNVAVEADFATLNALVEEAQWYAAKTDSEDFMADLSKYYNFDAIASAGDTVANEWRDGLKSTYAGGWKSATNESTNDNGNINGAASTYSDGVRIVNELVYTENEDGTYKFVNSGKTVKFSTPEAGFAGGVNDVLLLPENGEGVTIPGSGKRVEKLYFLWDACGSSQSPKVTVNYTDGTSETTGVYVGGLGWTYPNADNLAKKTYPNLAAALFFGWTNLDTEANGDGTYTVVKNETGIYGGLNMFYLDVDSTKNIESYTITPQTDNSDSTYDTYLFALTEKSMSNEDMMAVIDEAEKLEYVSTEADSELVKAAAAYARELNERHAVKLEDNQLVLDLEEQAIAQDSAYLDLSAIADTDLIAKTGDTEKYASRDDSIYVDLDEYITAKAPASADYIDTEAGTVFKLFGGWNGKGNDAVKVTPEDEDGVGVTIDLNDEMYKHISFLVDCIDADINSQTGGIIYADVTYTDGEAEEIEVTLRRGDSWYTSQQAASYGKSFGSWNATEGKYVNTGWVTGGNSVPEYAAAYPGRSSEGLSVFGFDITGKKTVQSVTLKPHAKAEYAIVAATATPYTNDELKAEYDTLINDGPVDADEVNAENAQMVIDGYNAMKELYERNYSGVGTKTIEVYAELYDVALKYNIALNTLKFTPSIVVENGTVTANLAMINTTENDKNYILIIAAYDANNQLVGVKSTDQATLASMTYSTTNSVSMTVPANASKYKALVWESKVSMDPITMIEK